MVGKRVKLSVVPDVTERRRRRAARQLGAVATLCGVLSLLAAPAMAQSVAELESMEDSGRAMESGSATAPERAPQVENSAEIEDTATLEVAAAPAPVPRQIYTETRAPCATQAPLKQAFFGDLHVHTRYSLDASTQGTRTTPAQAYQFALGERVDNII